MSFDPQRLLDGMFWFVAFLFSTTVHEAAHAFVALRGGDRTAYLGGQVSLSPIPHIKREPIGMVVVPLLTAITQGWAMGWASAPFDPAWEERHPRRAAWMGLAGPVGNFLVGGLAFALLRTGLAFGVFAVPEQITMSHLVVAASGSTAWGFVAQLLSVLVMLNVILGTFNLVPLPPLDGASVVQLVLPADLARKWRKVSRSQIFSLVGLLVAWRVFPYAMPYLFRGVIRLLG